MSTYWVSTPHWTISVTQQGDQITAIAPVLRRAWLGKPWTAFTAWVRRRYPDTWRAERLPEPPREAQHSLWST